MEKSLGKDQELKEAYKTTYEKVLEHHFDLKMEQEKVVSTRERYAMVVNSSSCQASTQARQGQNSL